MMPNEVIQAMEKLHGSFNMFNRQQTELSKTIDAWNARIRVEEKVLNLRMMQMKYDEKKLRSVQDLISLLGPESAKAEELQKRVDAQKEALFGFSGKLREMDRVHIQQMEARRLTINKFKATYKTRLQAVVQKKWAEVKPQVKQLNDTKMGLEAKLKSLQHNLQQKISDYHRQEDALDMESLRKQSRMEMDTKATIQNLQKRRAHMERQYQTRKDQIKVQAEGRIHNLREEYERRCQEIGRVQLPRFPSNRGSTPSKKAKKRKSEHPYLPPDNSQ